MKWKAVIFFLLISAGVEHVFCQAMDNTVSFRNIPADKYFRIFYENDFFSGTDRDYTQGIYIEKVKPCLKKFPLTKLLWKPRNDDIKYGLAIEHDAYTPNLIYPPEIQYGDRPYAAALFLKTFVTTINHNRRERISTILSTGIIGAGAGGEQMQKTIHHWINYTQPQGWHNQVSNDVVFNYQVNYEKELFFLRDMFSVSEFASGRVGTLSDKFTTGLALMAGKFSSPFGNNKNISGKKFQWYVYGQPAINFVGYDATLQGGVFNHSSPYIILAPDVERVVFQYRYGITLLFKKIYIEYFQTGNSKEFTTSIFHRTGGLEIGFGF